MTGGNERLELFVTILHITITFCAEYVTYLQNKIFFFIIKIFSDRRKHRVSGISSLIRTDISP
jgi:hypothetical protein